MFQRRIPEWLRHAPTPGARSFGVLAASEATARGLLITVYPVSMYRALGDAETVSEAYLLIGIASLAAGLLVPLLARAIPRRIVFTLGAVLMAAGALVASGGGAVNVTAGLAMTNVAVVVGFVCFNAYVMDFIERSELGQCETLRMFYSAMAWTLGPIVGILLMDLWRPLPFICSAVAALIMLGIFWYMRLGNGRQIAAAIRPAPNPIAYLPRFLAQPRLVAGWIFAVLRSSAWWVYVVYVPIYAVEAGYSGQLGGIMLSITNALLFVTPLMLRWMRRRSVRGALRTGFAGGALLFVAASLASDAPPMVLALLMAGSAFLILLDISAGLPYLMAVRPHERTEMAAVYATFRDVSGILTPIAARSALAVAPLSAIFAIAGIGLAACWLIAGRLHPRLGQARATAAAIPAGE